MGEPHKPESLDEIVSHSAVTVAEQIQAAATWAKSEMDLQVEVAGALRDFAKRAQIKLEGHHNLTIATGRPDSVYGSVIVEYKDPGTLSSNKGAAPNQALTEQLKRRFYDMRREEHATGTACSVRVRMENTSSFFASVMISGRTKSLWKSIANQSNPLTSNQKGKRRSTCALRFSDDRLSSCVIQLYLPASTINLSSQTESIGPGAHVRSLNPNYRAFGVGRVLKVKDTQCKVESNPSVSSRPPFRSQNYILRLDEVGVCPTPL